jgi:hypothetical protein
MVQMERKEGAEKQPLVPAHGHVVDGGHEALNVNVNGSSYSERKIKRENKRNCALRICFIFFPLEYALGEQKDAEKPRYRQVLGVQGTVVFHFSEEKKRECLANAACRPRLCKKSANIIINNG